MGRLALYFKELRREFQRINWPTRGEAFKMSMVVIVLSLLVAAFLGLLDFAFSAIIKRII